MSEKPFEIIRHDQAHHTEVYCNSLYHVTLLQPRDLHSGIPAQVSLTACNCKEKQATPSDKIPASDLAIVHSDVAKERFGDDVPEATGEPDLTNASIEGSEPEAQPPMTADEFEKLGQ